MNTELTNKNRLEMVLDGKIPDRPPHWELVFQIEKEMFGMPEREEVADKFSNEDDKHKARVEHYIEVHERLIDEYEWAAVPGNIDIKHLKDALGCKALIPAFDWEGVFWMPNGNDMMDFAVKVYEKPEELHQEARKKCDAAKERLKRYSDEGADFFVLAHDFGFNNAPFIAPEKFREIVIPYLTEIVETAHDLEKKAILHSDGCISLLLDDIYKTGIDGYQSVDPQGHMDIRKVREDFPDWILMGNVRCDLLQDTDSKGIGQAVRYCLEHGGVGKRYIFSTSNCIYHGMPPENYKKMVEEYRNYTNVKEITNV